MLDLLTLPAIGRAVSNGVFATKDLETPKGAGFDSAKKGVRPVAVGPCHSSQYDSWKFHEQFTYRGISRLSFGSIVALRLDST